MHNVPGDIELVVFDVDGVLTDGRIWFFDDGSEAKAFHTQDGFGIRRLLEAGLQVAVLSGRQSNAARRRMSELGVRHVLLGCKDKVDAFVKLTSDLGIDAGNTACVGDDVPDIPLLRLAGFGIAVANAAEEVKAECDLITSLPGGHGAVREICDLLLAARNRD
ncbi:MAG: HAD hydrolase family protein [Woeseiaceae bacterium]|nr:HAD hydrolase family protein [Woeseiaceae bacterium]